MKLDLKKDFPIFNNHPDLIYLDSTATSLKPRSVIDKLLEYYTQYSANIFRGVYKISEKATIEFEETRKLIAELISAKKEEVIFTRNTTESLNLIVYGMGRKIIDKNGEIVTTVMEHHSNFVPWQQLAFENYSTFKVIDINDNGNLEADLDQIITKETKILSLTHISNVLGTINPIKTIIKSAKQINPKIITVVDAAQSAPHNIVNVQDLGCDFLAFSSHKMLGPTGVGVLWGREELLNEMFPFMFGGEMISEVYIEKSTFKDPPYKFEAGTPSIGEVIAFKEAIKYINKAGLENIRQHEESLTDYCLKILKDNFKEEIKIVGPLVAKEKGGIVAFNFGKFHPHDIASILDEENIAVRAGNHCAMPLHHRLGVDATVRASFYLYNNQSDIDKLVEGLKRVKKLLS